MLNKVLRFIRNYNMLKPGERVVCAVSGGADSVALLFALYLLQEKLDITVAAAHFNHHLRQQESDRDEVFVRQICERFDIPLFVGNGQIVPGKKGLEAAARDARYTYLKSLPGKIATAHTANDNAETVLMHIVRGTGLKGLGGIAPVNGQLIRPMLDVTRQEVLAFLKEYNLDYITDSSNETDQFLRNRLRHHVMPLLENENPRIAENLSATALRLRNDEQTLTQLASSYDTTSILELKQMPPALRNRALTIFLKKSGVREPEAEHISLVEQLLYSEKPSAQASFPDGVVIARNYDHLLCQNNLTTLEQRTVACPGVTQIPELGMRIVCTPADQLHAETDCFTVIPDGTILLRCRRAGDSMRLSGGTKDLKKLFIDRKIPAAERMQIPVLSDDSGILGVYGIGANKDRLTHGVNAVQIRFEHI